VCSACGVDRSIRSQIGLLMVYVGSVRGGCDMQALENQNDRWFGFFDDLAR